MAIRQTKIEPSVYDNPIWPRHLPGAGAMRLNYSEFADELAIRFDEERHNFPVYVLIATPEYDYAAVKVDGRTGKVVGILVYPLVAYAVKIHPDWRAATRRSPDSSVAVRIVRDIKDLFDRYGIEQGDDEQE